MPPSVGRPKKYEIRKLIHMDTELADAIERFRESETDKPNSSEAIRRLLQGELARLGHLKD